MRQYLTVLFVVVSLFVLTTSVILATGGVISGTITDENGLPLENIGIDVKQFRNNVWESAYWTTTDANGNYEIISLTPGDYIIEFVDGEQGHFNEYYDNTDSLNMATTIAVTASSIISNINAQLIKSANITGTVTNDHGTPLENIGIDVKQFRNNVWEPVYWSVTDADGNYVVTWLAPGEYIIEFVDSEQNHFNEYYDNSDSSNTATTISVTSGSVISNINAQLTEGGHITGRVTDENGNPLDSIDVIVKQYDTINNWWEDVGWAYTDADGNYDVGGLLTGDYVVQFSDNDDPYVNEYYNNADSEDTATTISVVTGNTISNINAQLAEGGAVSGMVTDENNNPLEGIWAEVYSFDSNFIAYGLTDVNGNYEVAGLPTGDYIISFYEDDYLNNGIYTYVYEYYDDVYSFDAATTISVVAGTTTSNINAQLAEGGTIRGTVTNENGNPLEEIWIDVYDLDGNHISSDLTDASGNYEVGWLPTGDYIVWFHDGSGNDIYLGEYYNNAASSDTATSISVVAGSTTNNINAQLAETGYIAGNVTDESGNPLEEIWINVYDLDGNYISSNLTDANGNYEVGWLPTGDYIVLFHQSYYNSTYVQEYYDNSDSQATATIVSVIGGSTTSNINAQLAEGGIISGTITDESGNPLEEIWADVYDLDGNLVADDLTDANGNYEVTGLSTGDYIILFYVSEFYYFNEGGISYIDEYYDNAVSSDTATSISVIVGMTTSNINAQLAEIGTVVTATATIAPTVTPSVTITPSPTTIITPSPTMNFTITPSATMTIIPSPTITVTSSPTLAPTVTPSATVTITPSPTITITSSPTLTPTITPSTTATITPSPTVTVTLTSTLTPTVTPSATVIITPSSTVTVTVSPTVTITPSPIVTMTASPTITVTPSPTVIVTPQPTPEPDTGNITGQVTDQVDGSTLANITVQLYRFNGWSWNWKATTQSDTTGHYHFTNLDSASYRLGFFDWHARTYLTEYYHDANSINTGTDIVVTAGQTSTIDVALTEPGQLKGQITSEDGNPVDDITVEAVLITNGEIENRYRTTTNSRGQYHLRNLPNGQYHIAFHDTQWPQRYADQYYNQTTEWENADLISITLGTVETLDMSLLPLGTINGLVVDDAGRPASNVVVRVYQQTSASNQVTDMWEEVGWGTITDRQGQYRIPLAEGSYRVGFFSDWDSPTAFVYYDEAMTLDSATDVTVMMTTPTVGINATLPPPVPPIVSATLSDEADGWVSHDSTTGQVTIGQMWDQRTDINITQVVTCADGSDPMNVTLMLGQVSYSMTQQSGNSYETTIPADDLAMMDIGESRLLQTTHICAGELVETVVGQVYIDPSGDVTDAVTGEPIVGAVVTLYQVPGWEAKTSLEDTRDNSCQSHLSKEANDFWNQTAPTDLGELALVESNSFTPTLNPQLTNETGRYAWDVVAGCWYVTVQADGYQSTISPVVGVPPAVTDLDIALMPAPVIGFSQLSYTAQASETVASITITLNIPLTQTVTVSYTVDGFTGGVITFMPNETMQILQIPLKTEMTGTLTLALKNPTIASLGQRETAILTIIPEEATPKNSFTTYLPIVMK